VFREKIDEHLKALGLKTSWKDTSDFLKTAEFIEEIISPFMGGDDPLFGKRAELDIEDFFDLEALRKFSPDPDADINLIFGPGAALSDLKGVLAYIDLPKNEIQFRSRAGVITNLGASAPADPKLMYKRFYFKSEINVNTENKCHVLSLVEGSTILVKTESGLSQQFSYAETFVILLVLISFGSLKSQNNDGRMKIISEIISNSWKL